MTHFLLKIFAYIKKKQYLCSGFKTLIDMTDKTISSYQGYGHRVQLVRRATVAREFAVVDNRRVVFSMANETAAKDLFLNHVANIVRQLSLEL